MVAARLAALKSSYETSPEFRQIVRFLFAGGFAAFVNWLLRIGLSVFLPFWLAVLLAYFIGMSVGYTLYKHFVFVRAEKPESVRRQVLIFLGVNLFSALIVLGLSVGVNEVLRTALPLFIAQALAHGFAIAVGAVTNYLGHKVITFR
ncbi:Putative flippase GtrA (transmembrane translocase of bactoprenol-linked glucose) [Pseudovibrio denitrificans]|uniref:Putative flippase GtrA (Transmembrane translocase of bactoprenol-linked glucose) n=1 Tax=Pseudovibrio denitrificans TaxID=258256 RepID=A0A1I7DAW4_9HYPH|nr:GtrA family protein [Pseudovibrio denitrificans]SFU08765.1 Putative flippase GtrA (transmembrane translocase of bactoprenol-linked glucose) [Pseudovibrio denitrificans]